MTILTTSKQQLKMVFNKQQKDQWQLKSTYKAHKMCDFNNTLKKKHLKKHTRNNRGNIIITARQPFSCFQIQLNLLLTNSTFLVSSRFKLSELRSYLQFKLGKGGHIHEAHTLLAGPVLFLSCLKPLGFCECPHTTLLVFNMVWNIKLDQFWQTYENGCCYLVSLKSSLSQNLHLC